MSEEFREGLPTKEQIEAHYEPGKLRTRLCPHLGVPKPDTVGK